MSKFPGISLSSRKNPREPRLENHRFQAITKCGHVKPWLLSLAIPLGTFLVVFSALFSAPLMGQAVNATLLGSVTDSSGAAVANAKVTLAETNTGISHTSQTNDSGNYVFPDLPPGTYAITAEQSGFKRASRTGIDVIVNTTERVDLVLQPGNVTDTITVQAESPILQTERADTGRKLETVLTENMPLGTNRNFQNLLNLVPGTTRATFQHSQFFNASNSLQTEVNGQLREGNNYQIEGIDDNERTGLLQILIPPLEALQTVDVSTSNYEAELGRASGAVTNIILKSGTNGLHGAGYWFNSVSKLGARETFQPTKPVTTYNYYGFNLGGPIRKNKTFFFGDFLGVKDRRGDGYIITVPGAAFRAGDFSSQAGKYTVYDPGTGNNDTGVGRTPFGGNIIPDVRIS